MEIERAEVGRRTAVIVSSNVRIEAEVLREIAITAKMPFTDGRGLIACTS